jgi:hypothetical protein
MQVLTATLQIDAARGASASCQWRLNSKTLGGAQLRRFYRVPGLYSEALNHSSGCAGIPSTTSAMSCTDLADVHLVRELDLYDAGGCSSMRYSSVDRLGRKK